jgi:hypothetical protein
MKTPLILVSIIIISALLSCEKPKKENVIAVNMSAEIKANRLLPEQNDKISIAGNFNNWHADKLYLEDYNGDGIYTIDAMPIIEQLHSIDPLLDSLIFKFVITPGIQRPLSNQGWEAIPNRVLHIDYLLKEKPVLKYNNAYIRQDMVEAIFRVELSNQNVLGLFEPDSGDKVVVAGDFNNWNPDGVLLNKIDGFVYGVTLPVEKKNNLKYKFRIVTDRLILPFSGWENRNNRQYNWKTVTNQLDWFSDVQRVGRFIINTKKLQKEGTFNPQRGDILQLRFYLDGMESLSEQLIAVNYYEYETSSMFPIAAKKIEYQIVINKRDTVDNKIILDISQYGMIIRD